MFKTIIISSVIALSCILSGCRDTGELMCNTHTNETYEYQICQKIDIENSEYIIIDGFIEDINEVKLEIPSTIDGYKVTTISESAFYEENIETLTIPEGIVDIKASAFDGNKLSSITFPDSIENIEKYSFINNNISSVEVSNDITLSEYAFDDNVSITRK